MKNFFGMRKGQWRRRRRRRRRFYLRSYRTMRPPQLTTVSDSTYDARVVVIKAGHAGAALHGYRTRACAIGRTMPLPARILTPSVAARPRPPGLGSKITSTGIEPPSEPSTLAAPSCSQQPHGSAPLYRAVPLARACQRAYGKNHQRGSASVANVGGGTGGLGSAPYCTAVTRLPLKAGGSQGQRKLERRAPRAATTRRVSPAM